MNIIVVGELVSTYLPLRTYIFIFYNMDFKSATHKAPQGTYVPCRLGEIPQIRLEILIQLALVMFINQLSRYLSPVLMSLVVLSYVFCSTTPYGQNLTKHLWFRLTLKPAKLDRLNTYMQNTVKTAYVLIEVILPK